MNLHSFRKAAAASAVATSFAFSAFAAALPAPKEWVHGFINGYFSMIAYTYNGDSLMKTEIQMKKDGGDWELIAHTGGSTGQYTYDGRRDPFRLTLETGVPADAPKDNHQLMEFYIPIDYVGKAQFRMRANNGNGEVSDWVDLGESTAYTRLTGTWMFSDTIKETSDKEKVDNGRLENLIDIVDCWAGLDLGKTKKVRGVRYYSRGDGSFTRINGAYVQCADNPSFTDATTVMTISSSDLATADRRNITFLEFPEPVETRYVRMCSSSYGYQFSLAELEVVAGENPYSPAAASSVAIESTNVYPKVTWTVPAAACPVSNRVLRATALAGPYSPVGDWAEGAGGEFVDKSDSAKVSVGYYYKVEMWCDHPSFQKDEERVITSDAVHACRARRIDRDAEGALCANASYMTLTNGNEEAQMSKAFDGNTNSWPDTISLYYGPVGLKFTENVWVSAFGYACRHNQSGRMKMVALFSADADDVALDGKVQRSPRPTEVSTDGAIHYLAADSIPADGARQYFLWKCDGEDSGTFHGNVAELQFFGWTQDDVDAAGVLAPPTEVTFETVTGGIRVKWNTGTAASSYTVQRRVHGTDEWTDVHVGTDKAERSFDDRLFASANYDYRVIAIRGEESAATSVHSCIYYVPGGGTGLKSTLFWPFKAASAAFSAPTDSADLGVKSPNLEYAAEDEFAPGVTENACIAMKGKLIVPFTGAYTFRLDTADGGDVYVDDEWAVGNWVDGSPSGSMQLSAGEHEIEIHARLESAANRVKLWWSGPVNEELIPASQLVPSETAYTFSRGRNWNVRVYGGHRRGEVYGNAEDDAVTVKADGRGAVDWRNDSGMTFMARECRTSFTLSATLRDLTNASGDFGLLVRSANGNFLRFYGYNGGTGNAKPYITVLKDGTNSPTKIAGTDKEEDPAYLAFSNFVYDVKMVYDEGTFTCWMREHRDKPLEFTLVGSWTNDGTITAPFEVGYFVGGGLASFATGGLGKAEFTDRVFKKKYGTAIIVR